MWYNTQALNPWRALSEALKLIVKLIGTVVYKAEIDEVQFKSKGFDLRSWAEAEFSRQRETSSPEECTYKQYSVESRVYVLVKNHFTRKLEVAPAEVVSIDDRGITAEWPESEFLTTKKVFPHSEWMRDVFPSQAEAEAALDTMRKL